MRTIDKIIHWVDSRYGAPMGRPNVGEKPEGAKIYDCLVPLSRDGAYDRGRAYWGWGTAEPGCGRLRVQYTKDLSYIYFYRQ